MNLQQMQLARIEKATGLKQRDVNYPPNYERVIAALRECENVDECAEWSNQAAAAASYYKQANNHELEHASQRIRLRARLRCKELLDILDPVHKQLTQNRIGMGRREDRLLGDALKVRPPLRNAMIDAVPPATLARLAKTGNPPAVYKPQPGTGSAPGFAAVLEFWKMCSRNKPEIEAAKIDPSDSPYVKEMLKSIELWLGEFEAGIPQHRAIQRRG
jgi:hypothetical protein